MKEKTFSGRLVKSLRDLGVYAMRVENTVASGMPDIYALLNGQSFWIETKVTDKVTQQPRFERNQPYVMETLVLHGGIVFVAIGSEDGYRIRIVDTGAMIEKQTETITAMTAFIIAHVLGKRTTNGL